jgi:GTPase
MHFIDSTEIFVQSGDGGNGMVSFKTASNKPKLGPDGGDGGRGGDVVIIGHRQLNTLSHVRYKHRFVADHGAKGGTNGRTGANGANAEIAVPLGTSIYNSTTGEKICDILRDGESVVIAKGGRRGLGNLRFLSARHQAPTESTEGTPGENFYLNLELKLLADVGLAGFPNAGKSTLLSALSAARPKIADYPFTTLEPQLGVVDFLEGPYSVKSFVMADIPGLIEGASEGKGLGHAFLKHLERTQVIAFVLDSFPVDGSSPIDQLQILESELKNFNADLAAKNKVVILNKIDVAMHFDEAPVAALHELQSTLVKLGFAVFPISALTLEGLDDLKRALYKIVIEEKEALIGTTPQPESVLRGFRTIEATEVPQAHLEPFWSKYSTLYV